MSLVLTLQKEQYNVKNGSRRHFHQTIALTLNCLYCLWEKAHIYIKDIWESVQQSSIARTETAKANKNWYYLFDFPLHQRILKDQTSPENLM